MVYRGKHSWLSAINSLRTEKAVTKQRPLNFTTGREDLVFAFVVFEVCSYWSRAINIYGYCLEAVNESSYHSKFRVYALTRGGIMSWLFCDVLLLRL